MHWWLAGALVLLALGTPGAPAAATVPIVNVVLATQPVALRLRYVQALTEIAAEQHTTTVFPIPIDLLTPFLKKTSGERMIAREVTNED